MIARVWHGWTAPENADRYQELLETTVLPDIAAMNIDGYLGAELLREAPAEPGGEVEFVTILRFGSLEQIRAFTGDDYEVAHVPAEARELLLRFDARSKHYRHVRGPEADSIS